MSVGAPHRILAALLEARAGHSLSPDRIARIDTLLQPLLRERGLPSIEALVVELAGSSDRRLIDQVIDAMINHETYFFRDINSFREIDSCAFELLRTAREARKSLSIWCAGCSTGQEPYSLAMMIADAPTRWAGWDVRIVATDISPSVIAAARAGRYSHFEVQRGLPARAMIDWFEPDGSDWLLRGVLRERVRFMEHNLLTDPLPPGPFDLILCRNLLYYLTPQSRSLALGRLADALSPDGLLMLGAVETTIDHGSQRSPLVPAGDCRGFYRRAKSSDRPMSNLRAA